MIRCLAVLTSSCMLILAPLSNSTFTHSMCLLSETFISAVFPFCNNKCISSWEYHQCQIQYNIHTTHHSTTIIHRVIESTQGQQFTHIVQLHNKQLHSQLYLRTMYICTLHTCMWYYGLWVAFIKTGCIDKHHHHHHQRLGV